MFYTGLLLEVHPKEFHPHLVTFHLLNLLSVFSLLFYEFRKQLCVHRLKYLLHHLGPRGLLLLFCQVLAQHAAVLWFAVKLLNISLMVYGVLYMTCELSVLDRVCWITSWIPLKLGSQEIVLLTLVILTQDA